MTTDHHIDALPGEATGNADYDALPESVKMLHPLEGWLWLSEAEKGRLVQRETEPEA
jgi:hypothetical protein